jgi:hypothetical protein
MLRLAFLLLSCIAITFSEPTSEQYAGQYVFKVAGRNFVVLNVRHVHGRWTGSFARPKHATLGCSYSGISNETLTKPRLFPALSRMELCILLQGGPVVQRRTRLSCDC